MYNRITLRSTFNLTFEARKKLEDISIHFRKSTKPESFPERMELPENRSDAFQNKLTKTKTGAALFIACMILNAEK